MSFRSLIGIGGAGGAALRGAAMATRAEGRRPIHLWIVGILALLWNAMGAYDYLMTRGRDIDYLQSMMPNVDPNAILSWIDGFPIWAQLGWGLGVWMGLLGAVLLLVRSRWAVWSFALSLIGIILGIGYQLVAAPPPPGSAEGLAAVMPYAVIAVGVFLLWYSWSMDKKAVLR